MKVEETLWLFLVALLVVVCRTFGSLQDYGCNERRSQTTIVVRFCVLLCCCCSNDRGLLGNASERECNSAAGGALMYVCVCVCVLAKIE